MKTLLILRHAKAERDSESGTDFDRPLAEGGWRDARKIGREMRERGRDPDAVLASPARRVVETFAGVAEGYGPLSADYDRRVYNAAPDALIDLVQEIDDDIRQLLLVGHNPGLQELLLCLTHGDAHGHRDRAQGGLPTASLAIVELPIERWADVRTGGGEITDLVLVRDLTH